MDMVSLGNKKVAGVIKSIFKILPLSPTMKLVIGNERDTIGESVIPVTAHVLVSIILL